MRRTHRLVCLLTLVGVGIAVSPATRRDEVAGRAEPMDGSKNGQTIFGQQKAARTAPASAIRSDDSGALQDASSAFAQDSVRGVEKRTSKAQNADPQSVDAASQAERGSIQSSPSNALATMERRYGWIVLDSLELAAGAVSTRITGTDYGAPRPLTLWRIANEKSARFAKTWSLADGRFDFGQTLVPQRGIMLVVTEDDRVPDAWERDDAVQLFAPPPPPRVAILADPGNAPQVELTAAMPGGALVVADANGSALERIPLSVEEPPSPVVLDVFEAIWIYHELSDGRSSDWRFIDLTPSPPPHE